MKLPLFVVLALCLGMEGNCQSPYKYEVEKVTTDIYLLKPKINDYRWVTANIVVIINPDDVLIVDTGLLPSAAKEAIAEIRKLTSKPVRYVVNTHWHGDHWQGNEAFAAEYPNAEFITTEEGLKAMKRNGVAWIKTFYPKYLGQMIDNYTTMVASRKTSDGKTMTEAQLKELHEGLELVRQDAESIKRIKPTFPTLTFSQNMVLLRGSREIQLFYLGIGNTIGDAVVYLPQEKILIPGDLVVHPSPYESGAFSREWVATSKKLRDFPFQILIPGHGEVQHDANYLDYLNILFAEIFRQMDAAFLAGKTTLDEAKATVTHQSVVDQLNKDPRFTGFTKALDTGFVSNAVQRAFQQVKEGKL